MFTPFQDSHFFCIVFQPPGVHYRLQWRTLEQDFPSALSTFPQEIRGACSFCTHESVQALWYTSEKEEFRENKPERLGKRCIYANFSEIFSKSSGELLLPEASLIHSRKNPKKIFLEFFPASRLL